MVKKILLSMLIAAGATSVKAQDAPYATHGLMRATATYSAGFMTNKTNNGYLQGLIEYYFDESFSVRGDGFLFLFSRSTISDSSIIFNYQEPLLQKSSLHAGFFWHPANHPTLDPFIGIQPGISFSQKNELILTEGGYTAEPLSVNPVYSIVGGLNYYSGKHFHLFLEARYLRGVHLSSASPKYLDEFLLSFGLGFDVQLRKESR